METAMRIRQRPLLAQAEHDPMAAANFCLTTDVGLALEM